MRLVLLLLKQFEFLHVYLEVDFLFVELIELRHFRHNVHLIQINQT